MSDMPRWLRWAREIQALSQTGLHFSETAYHRERYQRLSDIAAEILSKKSGVSEERIKQVFGLQRGYATPKVDVRGAIVENDCILLVRERVDDLWCMPGGWADVGESPSEMVEREVREEAGVQVRAERLLGLYDANRTGEPLEFFHAYKLVFYCVRIEGSIRAGTETSDVRFFPFKQLPDLSRQRTDVRHLRDVASRVMNPEHPAAFD